MLYPLSLFFIDVTSQKGKQSNQSSTMTSFETKPDEVAPQVSSAQEPVTRPQSISRLSTPLNSAAKSTGTLTFYPSLEIGSQFHDVSLILPFCQK